MGVRRMRWRKSWRGKGWGEFIGFIEEGLGIVDVI